MIKYKIDALQTLKDAGYTTYKLRKDKLLGEATIQKLRECELVSWDNMNTICKLLNCQPGDIVEYNPDYRIVEIDEDERYGLMLRHVGDGWKIDGYSEIHPTFIEAEKVAKKISRS
jgi:putative transcriptional regulator